MVANWILLFIMSSPQKTGEQRLRHVEDRAGIRGEALGEVGVESEVESGVESALATPVRSAASLVPGTEAAGTRPCGEQAAAERALWISKEITMLTNATLDPGVENAIYVESLAEDMCTTLLSEENLDQVFVSVLFEVGVGTPLRYLSTVWNTTNNHMRIVSANDPHKETKFALYKEIKRLASGYASIMFYEPCAFIDEPTINDLVDELRSKPSEYFSFWQDILQAVVDNQTEVEFLSITLNFISKLFDSLDYTTDSEFNNLLALVEGMLLNKQIAMAVHKIPSFHPTNLKSKQLETDTVLGRILRISPLLPKISTLNYSSDMSKQQVKSIHESLQASYPITVQKMFNIINILVRASESSRIAVLTWMSDLVNKSHLRVGEHSNPKDLASDSLMLNITLILTKLTLPIIKDGSLSRIDKISIDYLNYRNRLIDIKDETKINSTNQEFNEYYADKMYDKDKRLNFISECFYLTLTYLHYGLGGMIVTGNKNSKRLKQAKEQYSQMKDLIENKLGGVNPNTNPLGKMLLSRLEPMRADIERFTALKLSIEMFFHGRELQLEIFDVIIGSIEYFIRLIDPTHKYHPSMGNFFETLKIPIHDFDNDIGKLDDMEYLRKLSPVPFKYFPELYLEGIINYCHFISKITNNPMYQNNAKLTKLIEFSIVVLRCPELVSNPHLKARLTEVLFFGSMPLQMSNGQQEDGYMIQIFNEDKVIQKNLLISLLDFYVMVEKTGASSQFYDKFNSRFHISYIVEQLWKFDEFKADLKRISENLQQFFVRLIARMLNDTTYLMDESLNHLHTIHECQKELAIRESPRYQPASEEEESTEDVKKRLAESERMAKTYVQLSNKTIHLFNLFTKEAPRSFVIAEIVDRLAGMLNYNLQALVGKKCNELKVKNPEEYKFDPKQLLFQLLSIYVNLSNEAEFVSAIARDLRSFDPQNVRKAVNILRRAYLVPDGEWEETLADLTLNAEEAAKMEANEEMALGEVPDEFLDPLMYTLMRDPVILPTSKVSMDRSVLKAHLMNDPTDPFNRSPLKLEEAMDDVDLKAKIQAWIQSKRSGAVETDGDIAMQD